MSPGHPQTPFCWKTWKLIHILTLFLRLSPPGCGAAMTFSASWQITRTTKGCLYLPGVRPAVRGCRGLRCPPGAAFLRGARTPAPASPSRAAGERPSPQPQGAGGGAAILYPPTPPRLPDPGRRGPLAGRGPAVPPAAPAAPGAQPRAPAATRAPPPAAPRSLRAAPPPQHRPLLPPHEAGSPRSPAGSSAAGAGCPSTGRAAAAPRLSQRGSGCRDQLTGPRPPQALPADRGTAAAGSGGLRCSPPSLCL